MSSENPGVRFFYAWVTAWVQDNKTTFEVLELIIAETPESIFAALSLIMKFTLLGEKEKALEFITPDFLGAAEHVEVFSRFFMEFFALLGEKEKAMDWVEKTIERGFTNYPFLAKHSPFLNTIRDENRFHRILETAKTRWENFKV